LCLKHLKRQSCSPNDGVHALAIGCNRLSSLAQSHHDDAAQVSESSLAAWGSPLAGRSGTPGLRLAPRATPQLGLPLQPGPGTRPYACGLPPHPPHAASYIRSTAHSSGYAAAPGDADKRWDHLSDHNRDTLPRNPQ
jgi:hypothetical protein